MSDRWTDRLSEYVDGDLDSAAARELESHLGGCAECAAAVEEIRLVVARARSLPERAAQAGPEIDLWPGIEARIRPTAPPQTASVRGVASWATRRLSFSVPQLAAACLAVAVVSAGAAWLARTGTPGAGPGAPAPTGGLIAGSGDSPERAGSALPAATSGTGEGIGHAGIEELRSILSEGRDTLDPATVRTLEESLMIIEIAIGQARRALDADPANPYVRAHLDETMKRKVDLLRRATMLASAPR